MQKTKRNLAPLAIAALLIGELIVGLCLLAPPVEAATCPAYTVPLSWSAPVTRADGTALPASQLGAYVMYLNGKAVSYPGATATMLCYAIANGQCINTTDVFTITSSDTNGLISSPSAGASVSKQVCGKPANPVAPVLSIAL